MGEYLIKGQPTSFTFAGNEIIALNITTGKTVGNFKREVADYFVGLQQNTTLNNFNFVSSDSVYKSIDLNRMVTYRHKQIKNVDNYTDITYSYLGDTLAAYDRNTPTGYIQNISANIKIPFLNSLISGKSNMPDADRPKFFLRRQ